MASDLLGKMKMFTVFSEVPDDRLRQMARETTVLEVARHDMVWNEGDTPRLLYLIVAGRVKIIKHSETGKDVIIEIFGPRDAIGESDMLVGSTYSTAAVCLSHTTLLCVPRSQILDLLSTVPGMALRSLRGMARRQRMLTQKIKELAAGGVEYRIAHLLLKLADRIGEESPDADVMIPIVLSRQDIADLVGTTVETAIRVMSRWRKMDIVTNEKRGIVIRDRETLEDLAAGITSHV
ncbi:MAG: Crp/Fnr family transcriptional regulator [Deltaproteobacteria bacterium]|nr:Crp/Fnr family transcriptional regulator [Deltaproteobacteria bacterium]